MRADRTNPLPLYIQVREDIRGQIEAGRLLPGDRLLLENALTEQYAVSSITIKRALRDLAREGIVLRIKRKGTFVSPRKISRPDSGPWSKTLALIIPAIEDLFLSEIYRGLADVVRRAGYAVSILGSDREIEKEEGNIRNLGARAEQGAVIFPNWGRAMPNKSSS